MKAASSCILVVEDDHSLRQSLSEFLTDSEFRVIVAACRTEALRVSDRERLDLVLLDQKLPDGTGLDLCREILQRHDHAKIIMMTAYPAFDGVVDALRAGAFDYLTKPFTLEELRFVVEKGIAAVRQEAAEHLLEFEEQHERQRLSLVGGLRGIRELADSAAVGRAPVLLTGETGTGKSMLARYIHTRGHRMPAPFVAINVAALPASLLESELFGHERGAFTGADRTRKGVFELAHGGTLLLDEIGSLAQEAQSKLLNVLDNGEVRRIGGELARRVSVRVLAATNLDLESAVAARTFRQDLFYRLNVIRIRLPPLRERMDDLPSLCEHLTRTLTGRRIEISVEELQRLREYSWPGNVRELRNVLERSLALDSSDALRPSRFLELGADQLPRLPDGVSEVNWSRSLEDVEREHVLRVYAETKQNLAATARVLQVAETTLRRKLRRYVSARGA